MTTATTPAYLRYALRLHAPAIVSTLAGPPGSALTQPFIPGSVIRGAVAARLLAAGELATGEVFQALVLSGEVRYLHAYPDIAGARGVPAPTSWRSKKGEEKRSYDLAAYSGRILPEHELDELDELWPTESLGPGPAPFVARSGSEWRIFKPRIDARLHQQRDRERGRSWKVEGSEGHEESHGTIFPCEYLQAEQVFHGVVQVLEGSGSPRLARLRELLSGPSPILIGRSRRAGYGGAAELTMDDEPRTQEYGRQVPGTRSSGVGAGEHVRLLMVSAYIGRHPETGQVDPTALELELCERLGQDAVTIERRRWSFETLGSFNRQWRLEVPQALAVAAGAVLVLKATRPIPADTLRQIEHQGLGERRVEGFGRVLFLEHSDDRERRLERHEPDKHDGHAAEGRPPPRPAAHEAELLSFIEERIVLAAARAELTRVAADIAGGTAPKAIPTSSLLGRIRTLFRGAHDERTADRALGELATWCGSGGDNPGALAKRARDQLDGCRVSSDGLLAWLRGLANPEQGQARWEAITGAVARAVSRADTLTSLAQKHHLTSTSAAEEILASNAAQLRVHLIDTVLAALARSNRRRGQS